MSEPDESAAEYWDAHVAHEDGALPCTGGCGRRLVGLDDPDGIAQGWTCAECQPVDTQPPMVWQTVSRGGPRTLSTMRAETAAEVARQFDEIRNTHGRPATADEVNRIAADAAARHWMSVLDHYALPSGSLVATPAPRCQVCGERGCERDECRLEPCPWCEAAPVIENDDGAGAGFWLVCCVEGVARPTTFEAAAAWNALTRNHRDAPGLRDRVAELDAEVHRLRAMLGEGWRDSEREQARRAREMED